MITFGEIEEENKDFVIIKVNIYLHYAMSAATAHKYCNQLKEGIAFRHHANICGKTVDAEIDDTADNSTRVLAKIKILKGITFSGKACYASTDDMLNAIKSGALKTSDFINV